MTDRLTRVMIVDDEDVFCTHLTGIMDWQHHGFYICAEAKNGLEAMELLKEYSPDIVITDIQMPKVDGLSLIEHISKEHPHIQVIALSGYDEYDSVRGSMKHGALDYLLKHQINSANLLETLNYANKRIDENHIKSATNEDFSEHARIGLSELRRAILRETLSAGFDSKKEFIDRTSQVGLDLSTGYFAIMVTEITQMNMHKSRYSDIEWMSIFGQMTDMVERLLSDTGNRKDTTSFLLPEPENRFTILFSMQKGYSYMHLNNYIITHIQSIRTALKRHFNFTANYSISNHINDFARLPEKYKQTLSKLESSSYQGHDMIIQEEKGVFNSVEPNNVGFDIDDETYIYALLRDGQTYDLLAHINILFDRQRSIYAGSERLQMMFVELLSVLSRLARKEHIDTYELFSERDIYSRMRYMTIDEMKQFFIDAYRRFTELRASHSGESSRELTQQACSYIRHNYKKPISLIDVADNVGVTPSYLSRIFKVDTGKTVVEYINKARIEAAILMIDDGVQLKGLAERVGFNSSNYFITVFRQATGKTPVQYKKTCDAL